MAADNIFEYSSWQLFAWSIRARAKDQRKIETKTDVEHPFQPSEVSFQWTSPSSLYKKGEHHCSPCTCQPFPFFTTSSPIFRHASWGFRAIFSSWSHVGSGPAQRWRQCWPGRKNNATTHWPLGYEPPWKLLLFGTAPQGTRHSLTVMQAKK